MGSRRSLYMDESPGERRGVVLLDGKPERLLVERDGEAVRLLPGAVLTARIMRIERGLGIAFLASREGEPMVSSRAALPDGVSEGAVVQVQITAPARADKAANAKVLGREVDAPRWITHAPDLRQRLQAFAPKQPIETGRDARQAADDAVIDAFQTVFHLQGGATVSVEPTRALIAVDVDVGSAAGQDARFSATKVNQSALGELARIARLKGLGGLVVVDLAGKGHNGPLLLETAKAAFAPDQPGVSIGAISRFGVLEMVIPWRSRPVLEQLAAADGKPTVLTEALALIRAIEREAGPGRQVQALCSPAVAAAAVSAAEALTARIGPRFTFVAQDSRPDHRWEAVAR